MTPPSTPTFIPHALPPPSHALHRPPPPHCRLSTAPTKLQTQLATLQTRTQSIKCPFWRRRFSDILDSVNQVMAWSLNRHKSLPIRTYAPSTIRKTPHLPLSERLTILTEDFRRRQYYVTGRLSQRIYRDDCLFDGPDPDVPVRGLMKYVSATAGLFQKGCSKVDLISICVKEERIVARWRLEGRLNLPWHPAIKPYTGSTTYRFDEDGLVESHTETWSVTALDAFVSVLFPAFGQPPAPPINTDA